MRRVGNRPFRAYPASQGNAISHLRSASSLAHPLPNSRAEVKNAQAVPHGKHGHEARKMRASPVSGRFI
jgi:hypothetical protein